MQNIIFATIDYCVIMISLIGHLLGIFSFLTYPIFWNWAIGAFVIILIVICIGLGNALLDVKNVRDDNLKLQIESHTIRNVLEGIRIKAKKLKRFADNAASVDDLNSIKVQTRELYSDLEYMSTFLSYVAQDNVEGQNMNTIKDEYYKTMKYIEFRLAGQNTDNVIMVNGIPSGDDFMVPARISWSMIENAFKHGDVNAPDFLSVTFEKQKDDYIILAKNKVSESVTFSGGVRPGGLGIPNMKARLKYFNANNPDYNAKIYKANKNGYFFFKLTFERNG